MIECQESTQSMVNPNDLHVDPVDSYQRQGVLYRLGERAKLLRRVVKGRYDTDLLNLSEAMFHNGVKLFGRPYNFLENFLDFAVLQERHSEMELKLMQSYNSGSQSVPKGHLYFWGKIRQAIVDEIGRRERIM
ncbi:hypothetical protein J4426_02635 [Candidatus Woesearchaeota archaeon]|nr:hypothetical protein [Candidatus Woesearchaeota archaeon]